MQQSLQAMGIQSLDTEQHFSEAPLNNSDTDKLLIHQMSSNATIPTRGTEAAARYDLYSAINITILAHTKASIPTDTLQPPVGTYAQILSRSGLLLNHGIEIKAGTIDHDFTGNVQVVLQNNSDIPFTVGKGD